MGIKAIETAYGGYLFRSRLEARWARLWDEIGLTYEYEKEGFQLDGGELYLPDFWIPKWQAWVEIKGKEPTKEEMERCEKLADLGHMVYLIYGNIGEHKMYGWYKHSGGVLMLPMSKRLQNSMFDRAVVAARSARFEHGRVG